MSPVCVSTGHVSDGQHATASVVALSVSLRCTSTRVCAFSSTLAADGNLDTAASCHACVCRPSHSYSKRQAACDAAVTAAWGARRAAQQARPLTRHAHVDVGSKNPPGPTRALLPSGLRSDRRRRPAVAQCDTCQSHARTLMRRKGRSAGRLAAGGGAAAGSSAAHAGSR
jgi:hypothetical protein